MARSTEWHLSISRLGHDAAMHSYATTYLQHQSFNSSGIINAMPCHCNAHLLTAAHELQCTSSIERPPFTLSTSTRSSWDPFFTMSG